MIYDRWLEEPYQRENAKQEAFDKFLDENFELVKDDGDDSIYLYMGELIKIRNEEPDGEGGWDFDKVPAEDYILEEIDELINNELVAEILIELIEGDNEKIIETYRRLKSEDN